MRDSRAISSPISSLTLPRGKTRSRKGAEYVVYVFTAVGNVSSYLGRRARGIPGAALAASMARIELPPEYPLPVRVASLDATGSERLSPGQRGEVLLLVREGQTGRSHLRRSQRC